MGIVGNFQGLVAQLDDQTRKLELEVSQDPLISDKTNAKIRELGHQILSLRAQLQDQWQQDQPEARSKLTGHLDSLIRRVEELKRKMPSNFHAAPQTNVEKIVSNTIGAVQKLFDQMTRGFIFEGANRQIENLRLPQRLSDLYAKETRLVKNYSTAKEALDQLYQKRMELRSQDNFDERALMNAEEEIDKLKSQVDSFDKEYKTLRDRIARIEKRLETHTYYSSKGEEMREQCKTLGGEVLTITTPDKVKLDSVYLDAQKFRDSISNAGGQLWTMAQPPMKLQAIAFPEQSYLAKGKDIHKALEGLHALSDPVSGSSGMGWSAVRQDGAVLFVRTQDLPSKDNVGHPLFQFNVEKNTWILKESGQIEKQDIDTEQKASGTVIMSSGSLGVYEQHKAEACFYLLKNMNVLMFNFRGYGRSQGRPTEEGMKLDMESAYQAAKAKSGHEDKKILFKALCMSGGPASHVAAQHPDTNIFLDQSYSDFKRLTGEYAISQALDWLEEHLNFPALSKWEVKMRKAFHLNQNLDETGTTEGIIISEISKAIGVLVQKATELISPDFPTAKALANNRGHKALFFTQDDTTVDLSHVADNMRAVAKAGQLDYLTVISGPGSHGAEIVGIQASPLDFSPQARKLQQKAQNLQKAAQKLREEAQRTFRALDSKAKEAKEKNAPDAEKLRAEADKIIPHAEAMAKRLESDANDALRERAILSKDSGFGLEQQTRTGQQQLDRFLTKAGLSQEMIKTEAELRPSSTEQLAANATGFINLLENLRPLSAKYADLMKGEITGMRSENGSLVFSTAGKEIEVSREDFESLARLGRSDRAALIKITLDLKRREFITEGSRDEALKLIDDLNHFAKTVLPICKEHSEKVFLPVQQKIQVLQQQAVQLMGKISQASIDLDQKSAAWIGNPGRMSNRAALVKAIASSGTQLTQDIAEMDAKRQNLKAEATAAISQNPLLSGDEAKLEIEKATALIDGMLTNISMLHSPLVAKVARGQNLIEIGPALINEKQKIAGIWAETVAQSQASKICDQLVEEIKIAICDGVKTDAIEKLQERVKGFAEHEGGLQKLIAETRSRSAEMLDQIEQNETLTKEQKSLLQEEIKKDFETIAKELEQEGEKLHNMQKNADDYLEEMMNFRKQIDNFPGKFETLEQLEEAISDLEIDLRSLERHELFGSTSLALKAEVDNLNTSQKARIAA